MNSNYKVERDRLLIIINNSFFVYLDSFYMHIKQLKKLDAKCYKKVEEFEYYLKAKEYIIENLIKEFYKLEDLDIHEKIKNAYTVFKLWYIVKKEFSFISGVYLSEEPKYFPKNLEDTNKVFTFSIPNECEDIDNLIYALEYNPKDYNMIFLTNEVLEILDKDDMILFNNFLSYDEVQKVVSDFCDIENDTTILETDLYSRTFNRKLKRLKKILRNLNKEL